MTLPATASTAADETSPFALPLTQPQIADARLLARATGLTPSRALRLLAQHGALTALRHADVSALCAAHDLAPDEADRLQAALELAEHLVAEHGEDRPCLSSPQDAARLVLPAMGLAESEQMRLLVLDTKHRLLANILLYTGTLCACDVRVAEVFRAAVRYNGAALIVLHNHPSGDPEPSPEDVVVTRALVQAGQLLDIRVLDHLVIGGTGYTSLRERGLGWC